MVEYIALVPAVCAATVPVNECVWNCSVTDCDGVPSEYDAIQVYLGELEIQCIATPETYVDWKFRREDEIAGFFEALPFHSEGESLIEQFSRTKILHHHTHTRSRHSKD